MVTRISHASSSKMISIFEYNHPSYLYLLMHLAVGLLVFFFADWNVVVDPLVVVVHCHAEGPLGHFLTDDELVQILVNLLWWWGWLAEGTLFATATGPVARNSRARVGLASACSKTLVVIGSLAEAYHERSFQRVMLLR